MSAIDKFRNLFDRATTRKGDQWLEKIPAFLGKKDGTVATDVYGVIWVRDMYGQELKVFNNNKVDLKPNMLVRIGRHKDEPNVWQVVSRREAWGDLPAGSGIQYHHEQHEFMGPDMVMLDRRQISQLSVIVKDGAAFTVQFFGGMVRTAAGMKKISSQVVDLSSYVPTDGAIYANIEADNNGVLSVELGTPFAGPALGDVSYIATPAIGKYLMAVVRLYEGQSELSNDDIVVPMPMQVMGSSAANLGWFNVKDYGALGDGVTNDSAAISSANAALTIAGGGVLYFPPGVYKTSGGFTLSVPCLVLGGGMGNIDGSGAVTQINCTSATAVVFTTTTYVCKFQNIALKNTAGSTPSAGAGISVTGAYLENKVDFDSVSIYGFYNNFDIQVGAQWSAINCFGINPVKYGLKVQNTVNIDAGDWSIVNCNFNAGLYDSDAAIRVEGSGGGKIINTKINCAPPGDSHTFNHGIDVTPSASGTGNVQITNCSIENVRGDGIHCAGFGWHDILIFNVEFGLSYAVTNTTGRCISIGTGYSQVIIVGCTLRGGASDAAISLTGVTNARLAGNINITATDVLTQSGCTNVVVLDDATVMSSATPQDVGSAGSAGTGTSPSADDHVHEGVHSVNGLTGDVTIDLTGDVTIDVSGGAGQVTVIARWVSGGGTTFDLPDVAEYLIDASDDGSEVDPLIYSLSSDHTQLVFDSAITAGHIVTSKYILTQV